MNKNEILEKAQNSTKPDEMELHVMQKGQSLSMFVMVVVALVFMVIKLIKDQSWYDVDCIIFAGMATVNLYKFFKIRERHHLNLGIITAIAAIFTFVRALIDLLG